ncbi:MAG: hypothetical protein NVS3B20_27110 [Polyangiales bacterium]
MKRLPPTAASNRSIQVVQLVHPENTAGAQRPAITFGNVLSPPDERKVIHALTEGVESIDQLVLFTGLEVRCLRALLLTWTVEGVVREGPAGLFRLINS